MKNHLASHATSTDTEINRTASTALLEPAQPSRFAANAAGLVLFLALSAGIGSVGWSMATGRIDMQPADWTLASILSGESSLHLASELADTPLPNAMADAERAASWLITGSLGPRVRQGCDSWLFLTDELKVHPEGARNVAKRLDTVVKVRDLLKRRGAELVVATVPDKSRVQSADLCDVYRPPSSESRLMHWEHKLTERGIHHASLLGRLQELADTPDAASEQAFLKTDTHWTQTGAYASAQEIANTVDSLNMSLTPRQSYALSMGEPQPREGDLVRLAGIDWLWPSLLPAPDIVEPLDIEPTRSLPPDDAGAEPASTQSDSPGDAALDLFGDANLPSAALIGTSFSRTSSFAPLLEMALQTPVPSFAMDGGDFWGSAKKYLSSSEFLDAPPKIVFWEIPERVLEMPVSADEQAWMDSVTNP